MQRRVFTIAAAVSALLFVTTAVMLAVSYITHITGGEKQSIRGNLVGGAVIPCRQHNFVTGRPEIFRQPFN